MYANPTCEISLLSGSRSSLRKATPAVFQLQANLADSPQEARSQVDPNIRQGPYPSSLGRMYAALSGQAVAFGVASFSLPVSPSTPETRSWSVPAPHPSRTSYLAGRWPLVLFSRQTLDSLSHRCEAVFGEYCSFPGSRTASRSGRHEQMEKGGGRASTQYPGPNSGHGRRQSSRNETVGHPLRLAAPAVSFPSDLEAPNPARKAKTSSSGWFGARNSVPVDPAGSRSASGTTAATHHSAPAAFGENLLRHPTNPWRRLRISEFSGLLPGLQNSSQTPFACHYQCRRIHGKHHSKSSSAQSLRFQSKSSKSMGNGSHTHATKSGLQWQRFSTELIDPTPNCDILRSS